MSNRVKLLRKQLGLTQRQLANQAGISQQQIQRIEAGLSTAKLDTATKICEALGKPMNTVFPGSTNAIMKVIGEMETSRYLPSKEDRDTIRATGIELDPCVWKCKVWMAGHSNYFLFSISSQVHDRLFSAVQGEASSEDSMSFVVFDTETHRVAINLAELACCQFLFDPLTHISVEKSVDEDERDHSVEIFLIGSTEPLEFDVDTEDPDEEDGLGQMGHIFYMLDTSTPPDYRFHFDDSDGESAFIRSGNIAMLKVPLKVLESDLEDDSDSLKPVS
jgi:DNA-binding XRE family transcriptional regulator